MTLTTLLLCAALLGQTERVHDDFRMFPGEWTTFGPGEWERRSGHVVQKNAGFDIGATLPAAYSAEDAYTVEVVFEPLGDFHGAGVLFNCRRRDSVAESMMVRVDNNVLLYGYFGEDSVFEALGAAPIRQEAGKRSLRVAVDNSRLRFHASLDGARIVSDAPMRYGSGFVGVTSSGGPHAFLRFRAGPATQADLQGMTSAPIRQPYSVALSDEYVYVLTRGNPPVQMWTRDGRLARKFGAGLSGLRKIETMVPASGPPRELLAIEGEESLYVWEVGGTGPLFTLDRPKGAIVGTVLALSGEETRAYVWVTEGKEILVQDITDGRILHRVPAPELNRPTAAAMRGGTLYVADSDMSRARFETHVYVGAPEFRHDHSFSSWLDPKAIDVTPEGDLAYVGGLGYYEPGGCVRVLRPDGSRVGHAAMFPFGTVSRRGDVAADRNGDLYVADPLNDAVYVYKPDLREPDPVVTQVPGGVRIRWWSPAAEGGRVRIGTTTNGARWQTVPARRDGEFWEADVTGLPDNTRHYYRFYPGPRMLPETRESRVYSLVTSPPAGMRQAVELDIVTAIYPHTKADGQNEWSIPEEGVVEKVRREFDKARLFYWRNSRCRLHLNVKDYVVIRDVPAEVKGGWVEPAQVKRDLLPYLAKLGRRVDDYDSIVCVWATPDFEPATDDELGAVGGGGLTPYGYSTFGIGGRLAWLMVHEYNHQVDAFYDGAGSVEYRLNHPDATVHPGRYGQHFDCNAYLNRLWRDDQYLTNTNFGRIVLYADRDGDGLPDDDLRFPMDELAFGSDPAKEDTDGDGLDDLGEFMAGIFSAADPTNPDSDGDRQRDGDDPWPIYSAEPVGHSMVSSIRPRPIVLVEPNSLYPQGSDPSRSRAPGFGEPLGNAYVVWGPNMVRLIIDQTSGEPMQIEWDLDWRDDGWFTGGDNHSFSFDTGTMRASVEGTTVEKEHNWVLCTVPPDKLGGGTIEAGHKFGMRLRVTQGDRAVSAFDPWSLFVMTLER